MEQNPQIPAYTVIRSIHFYLYQISYFRSMKKFLTFLKEIMLAFVMILCKNAKLVYLCSYAHYPRTTNREPRVTNYEFSIIYEEDSKNGGKKRAFFRRILLLSAHLIEN